MSIPNNPTVGQEWVNDETGVTYKWDGERWYVVSTSEADAAATFVKKSGDTMSGDLMFSETNNIIALNDNLLRIKSSRNDDPSTSATHITIGKNAEGESVTNIYHLQRPQQPEWAVNMEYSDEQDQLLQNQIDTGFETQQEILSDVETLQNKVNALEGSVIDATWSFEADNRAPRDGEFGLRANGISATTWASAQQILISFIDSSGETYTLSLIHI